VHADLVCEHYVCMRAFITHRSYSLSSHVYGLECFSVAKHDVRSLDFAVTRFLMKLFRSSNINVIDECRLFFNFMLPSEKIEKEESVLRVNFRIVSVCCTVLTLRL